MKFRTADLIARVDDAIEARKKAAEKAKIAHADAIATQRADWLAKHGPEIVEFCNRAKDKIRKGRMITQADLPGKPKYGSEFPVYNRPEREPKEAFVGDLLTLRAALSAIEDEYVTTTSLREIGFKDVARLFTVSA